MRRAESVISPRERERERETFGCKSRLSLTLLADKFLVRKARYNLEYGALTLRNWRAISRYTMG